MLKRGWIAPSVMCADILHLQDDLRALEEAGVELLHIDVMDNHFVPNLMLPPYIIRRIRQASRVPLDIHLMITQPEACLAQFDIQPGEYVSLHAESTVHLQRALGQIRDMGAHPAVALNPATPAGAVEEVLGDIDMVLLMAVNPGYSGQKLVASAIEKIARMRAYLNEKGRAIPIEVDGNVSLENARRMRAAGADIFVGGTSSVFMPAQSIAEGCAALYKCIE